MTERKSSPSPEELRQQADTLGEGFDGLVKEMGDRGLSSQDIAFIHSQAIKMNIDDGTPPDKLAEFAVLTGNALVHDKVDGTSLADRDLIERLAGLYEGAIMEMLHQGIFTDPAKEKFGEALMKYNSMNHRANIAGAPPSTRPASPPPRSSPSTPPTGPATGAAAPLPPPPPPAAAPTGRSTETRDDLESRMNDLGSRFNGLIARTAHVGVMPLEIERIRQNVEAQGIDRTGSIDDIAFSWSKKIAEEMRLEAQDKGETPTTEEIGQLEVKIYRLIQDLFKDGVFTDQDTHKFAETLKDYEEARDELERLSVHGARTAGDDIEPPVVTPSKRSRKSVLAMARESARITRLQYERQYVGMGYKGLVAELAPVLHPNTIQRCAELYRTEVDPQAPDFEAKREAWAASVAEHLAEQRVDTTLGDEARQALVRETAAQLFDVLNKLSKDFFWSPTKTDLLVENVELYRELGNDLEGHRQDYFSSGPKRYLVEVPRAVKEMLASPGALGARAWVKWKTRKNFASPEQLHKRRRAAKFMAALALGYTITSRAFAAKHGDWSEMITSHWDFDLLSDSSGGGGGQEGSGDDSTEQKGSAESPGEQTAGEDKNKKQDKSPQWLQPGEPSIDPTSGGAESPAPSAATPTGPEAPPTTGGNEKGGDTENYTMSDDRPGYKGHPNSLSGYADLIMEEHGFDKKDPDYVEQRDKVVSALVDTNDTYHGEDHWINKGQEIDLSAGHEIAEGFEGPAAPSEGAAGGAEQETPGAPETPEEAPNNPNAVEVPEGYPAEVADHLNQQQIDALRLRRGDGGEALLQRWHLNPDRWQDIAPDLAKKYPDDIYTVGIDSNGDGARDFTDYRLNMTSSGYIKPELAIDMAKALKIWR